MVLELALLALAAGGSLGVSIFVLAQIRDIKKGIEESFASFKTEVDDLHKERADFLKELDALKTVSVQAPTTIRAGRTLTRKDFEATPDVPVVLSKEERMALQLQKENNPVTNAAIAKKYEWRNTPFWLDTWGGRRG